MNPTPIVSIVMPAYNAAPYIGETLDSVFRQTFTNYEVIVINDGSPDTVELEQALEPYIGRIRYIKQENLGAGAARNEGLRASQGEFIAFLDADDLWLPTYLEEQLKFIHANDVDLVCADAMHFGDSPLVRKTYMEAFMETAPVVGEVTFLGLVSAEQSLITSGIVARRAPIIEVGLFDEGLRNSQDFDLWLRLVRHGARLAYQRRLLLRYRCHENSLSGDEINRIARQLRVYNRIESSFDLTPEECTEVSRMVKQIQVMHELELSKSYLSQGKFAEALIALNKANNYQRSWKLRGVKLFLLIAPRLLRRLHAWRS